MEAVKESIRNYWDREAAGFDLEFGHGLRNQHHKQIWLDILKRNVPCHRQLKILDVGCGTGFLSLLLSELGHTVYGLDFSPRMIAVARDKARRNNLPITFSQGDAEVPPFPAGRFDFIICRHLIWTLPHPDQALKNWQKLLSPGGGVILIEGCWTTPGWQSRIRKLAAILVQILEQKKIPEAWEKTYVPNLAALPLFGGRPSRILNDKLKAAGFLEIWKDDLTDLIENEQSCAPLSYKIRYAYLRERRYLIGAKP